MKTTILILTVSFLVMLFNIKAPAQKKNVTSNTTLKPAGKKIIPHITTNGPTAIKNTVANGNWSSGSTWNGGAVPNTGDDITIMNNVTLDIVDSTISTGNLTINSGFTLTLNPETNLDIEKNTIISGTLLVDAGSLFGTWVYPAGNFTINSGGTFNCSASNTHIDFIGIANQTLTNNGTITPPISDFSIDNTHNITLAGSGSIVTSNLNINTGVLVNSALHNITISSGGLLNRGDGSISITPLGALYDLMYTNIVAINSGPEIQNNTVIRDLIISSSDNVTMIANATVNRNFDVSGGNLNIGAFNLTLNGGITFGGFFGTLTGGATSKLTLGGSGSVTLPDIQTQQLNTLTINRGANDIITLGGKLLITNILDMESGNINTGSNVFTLGSSGTSVGTLTYNAGANTGVITGKFTRWFGTSTTQPVVKFPVGDVSANASPRMLSIQYTTPPTTAGTLTAQYITGDPGFNNTGTLTDSGPYSIDTYSKVGYWQVDATTIAGGTYSITINPVGFVGMNVFAKLRVLKRSGSGVAWSLQGNHVAGTSTPTASRSGLSGFSQFGLGGNDADNPLDGVLPIELSSFSSSVNVNNVKLTWITASETNNQGFEIYRKSEQTNWMKIGFVSGNGTVNTPKTYTYNDNGLSSGKYSYELKQIDFNGNFGFFVMSGITEIGVPKKFEASQNYPNPFNPSTTIDYSIPQNAYVTLKIYDMSGKEIAVLVNSQTIAGYHSVNFNSDSYHLSSGVYFYKLSASGFSQVKQMVLIK